MEIYRPPLVERGALREGRPPEGKKLNSFGEGKIYAPPLYTEKTPQGVSTRVFNHRKDLIRGPPRARTEPPMETNI